MSLRQPFTKTYGVTRILYVRKKLSLTLVTAVALTVSFAGLLPMAASASVIQDNSTDPIWIDHSDISYGGVIYHDGLIDDVLHFQAQGQTGCAVHDEIDISLGQSKGGGDDANAHHTATFHSYSIGNGNNTSCAEDNIPLASIDNPAAYDDYFVWVDAGTIKTSDLTEATFTLSTNPTNPNFIESGGKDFNSKCRGQINTTVGSNSGQLILWDSQDNSDSNGGDGPLQQGWPDTVNKAPLKHNDGGSCAYSDPIPLNGSSGSDGTKASPGIADPVQPDGSLASSIAAGTGDGGSGGGGATVTAPSINCKVSITNPLSWFLCPLTAGLETVAGQLDSAINSALDFSPTQLDDYQTAFDNIRNVSLGLIGVGALTAIISEAAGFEIFDAYSIRKILPRLLACAIGISLAWPLLKTFVGVSDGLGAGIRSLIYLGATGSSGGGANLASLGGGGTAVATVLAGAAVLGFVGLLSFAATAALAVAIAFLVLILRQLVIIALVVFAPIAIACYLLPNTQRVWKLWWDSFSKALMMFPIIAGFIALGRVFSALEARKGGNFSSLIAFVAYFAPYFLLPFTFRLAGGAISTIGGFVNDRGRGGFDRLSKFRANRSAQNLHAMREGNRFRGDNIASNAFNRTTRNAALIPSAGFNPAKMRDRMKAAGSRNEMSEMAEYMEKNADFKAIMGNDDYLQATMENMGGGRNESDWRRYLGSIGYDEASINQGVAAIRSAKRGTSNEVFERAAVVANASTGTGWKEGGAAQMMQSINGAAGGDRDTAARMLAEMRTRATQARRVDLAGAGFGTSQATMNKMFTDGNSQAAVFKTSGSRQMNEDGTAKIGASNFATDSEQFRGLAEANDKLYENALLTQGPGAIVGARGDAIRQLAPQMLKRIKNAHDAVETASPANRAVAEQKLVQEYAALANNYDVMSHAAPESAQHLANSVMAAEVGGETIKSTIDRLRSDPGFLQTRRELSDRAAADQASRQGIDGPMGGMTPPMLGGMT